MPINVDRILPKKKWSFQRLLVLGAIIGFLGFVVFQVMANSRRSTLNVQKDRLVISEVTKGVFDEFTVMTGVVQPLKTYQLDAVEGGYVAQKLLDGGASVKTGDLILRLENQRLTLDYVNRETEMYDLINNLENTRLRLRQDKFTLKKNLAELDFQLREAQDNHERNTRLFEDNVISAQEFNRTKYAFERLRQQREIEVENQQFQEENSLLQIRQLEGTLERTRLNQSLMKKNLENLSVKAPVSGLLSRVDVEVGQSLQAGQNIGQIDDLSGFRMRVEVDEHFVSRVFPGLEGAFEFDGKQHRLTVSKVFPEVRNGRFSVDMDFGEALPASLRRGQSVPVRLQLGKPTQALLLPVGGFIGDTGGAWVYVLSADGNTADKRRITLGRKNSDFFEVLDGLSAGEKVITSSYQTFGEKDRLVF